MMNYIKRRAITWNALSLFETPVLDGSLFEGHSWNRLHVLQRELSCGMRSFGGAFNALSQTVLLFPARKRIMHYI